MTDHTELEENVRKADQALADAKAAAAHQEFPKHVEVHPSHVVEQKNGDAAPHISVPGFASHHADRAGKVTVLVHDVEEETKAMAEKIKETV